MTLETLIHGVKVANRMSHALGKINDPSESIKESQLCSFLDQRKLFVVSPRNKSLVFIYVAGIRVVVTVSQFPRGVRRQNQSMHESSDHVVQSRVFREGLVTAVVPDDENSPKYGSLGDPIKGTWEVGTTVEEGCSEDNVAQSIVEGEGEVWLEAAVGYRSAYFGEGDGRNEVFFLFIGGFVFRVVVRSRGRFLLFQLRGGCIGADSGYQGGESSNGSIVHYRKRRKWSKRGGEGEMGGGTVEGIRKGKRRQRTDGQLWTGRDWQLLVKRGEGCVD